jgi:hypothetical protein
MALIQGLAVLTRGIGFVTNAMRFASIVATLLLATASIAGAQVARKYVTPDGKVIYSDVPVPGSREVGEVAPPPRVDPEASSKAERDARNAAARAAEAQQRLQEDLARQERIRAAEVQLENARNTLANGREPLPGERIGTAGGNSRLTDAYFERQKANQRAVEQAQRQLDAARAGR